MSESQTLGNCRFCSVVSKNSGEDPIGTAGTYDHWLIVELALPWTEKSLREDPKVQPIMALIQKMSLEGMKIQALAIAPNQEYSQPGSTRVLYYRRPAKFFAQFEKQEFCIPTEMLPALATALLTRSQNLPQFEVYRQETQTIRDLFVCTHGNVDIACARFGYPIYQTLKRDYARHSNGKLRVWQCSHFGGHRFAPTLLDLPEGRYWGRLEPNVLDTLISRTGSVKDLSPFYRGWAGLTQLAQIVEREIWIREGWDWLNYLKAENTIPATESHNLQKPDGVAVQIDFVNTNGDTSTYQAQVGENGEVMSLSASGDKQPLTAFKQYHVIHLKKKIRFKQTKQDN
ncbi:sucrase ferredoxin [Leptolyngbya sp. AN02str]|uniref:sucrase ferredoxin n=1 Tax=Leptolyngbya sp. AN02str TaxID=3423363 RepID=UPI003D3104A1